MITLGHKDGSIEKMSLARVTQIVKGYKTHTVIGGEFAIVRDDEEIAFKTLLGSCVAIIFYDKEQKIKGMNHFLLPSTNNSNEDMKYGLYSVEAMLNEMYKMGCRKQNMAAKISGGADIVNVTLSSKSIGHRNVEFAMDFCASEGFRIISNHTRGVDGRVILVTNGFETFIKTVENNTTTSQVMADEKKLQIELSVRKPAISEYGNNTDLFGLNVQQEQEMEIELF
ncbi:MAG: chemotaxis protein CheD [Sulfurovum sp. FS06-10]|nr:MAG: chemotaxis protein CheD [Sulfurovum sp. FS06-10]